MNKHAYLIIANNRFNQLSLLLQLLDNARNDFFILIDQKSAFTSEDKALLLDSIRASNLYFCSRIPIFWGQYSQVAAEMKLFKMAYTNNIDYSYYHLLSGVDLPIVSNQRILDFFDKHPNRVFLTMATMNKDVYNRVRFSYHWIKYTKRSIYSKPIQLLSKVLEKISLLMQQLLQVDHFKSIGVDLGYASNWVSLDNETVKLIVDNSQWINETFKNSFLCDELFIPTLLNKYPSFKSKIYYSKPVTDKPDEFQGNLRYINWWDGSPYTWQDGDERQIQRGVELGHLFSRKFDIEKSPKLKNYLIHLAKKDERNN